MTDITLPRATVEQALEALKYFRDTAICSADTDTANEVIPDLEAALAQQAEPVEPAQKPITRLFGTLPVHDAQQAEPVCKCDLRTRLVGDGCEVCNPKLAAELAQQDEPVAGVVLNEEGRAALAMQRLTDAQQEMERSIESLKAALAQQAEPVATITECEACFTPDVCQLRGTCDYYTASQMRIAAPQQQAEPVEPVATHRINSWGFCGVCRHDRIPGEGCARQECPDSPQQAEPVAVEDRLARHGIPMPGDSKC